MPNAIMISKTGGPEVLEWQPVDVPKPNEHEVKIKHTAIGLNYIDTYMRTGLYKMPLPGIPGLESAGIIQEIGEAVTGFAVGDRVVCPCGPAGSYAEERVVPADKIVKIPAGISDETAAAIMLKACTVEFLVERLFKVEKNHTVLLQAAAGGVGLIACQWLSSLGATVIGTVSSDAKAEIAKANGCTHTINYREEDFHKRTMEITGGEGVHVVYDSAGKDTFEKSINCLKPRGMMVTYGNTTGPVDPIAPGILAQKGSIFLTRPTLFNYVSTHEELLHSTNRVFEKLQAGILTANINQRFELKEAGQAHQALEAGETKGQSLLIP